MKGKWFFVVDEDHQIVMQTADLGSAQAYQDARIQRPVEVWRVWRIERVPLDCHARKEPGTRVSPVAAGTAGPQQGRGPAPGADVA